MAYTYTISGGSQATTSNLTQKLWDKVLHEQVQNKLFWKDLIGKDKGGEGSIDESVANFPIVEKTQLGKSRGDRITLGLVTTLVNADEYSNSYYDDGKVATQQLVENENTLVWYYLNVTVGLYRHAVRIEGEMTEQRSPFDIQKVAQGLLSTHLAKFVDDSVFMCFYTGYSTNVLRELNQATVTHPNRLFGKNRTALTDITTADILDADMLERYAVLLKENKINPVILEGDPCYGLVCHPRGMRTLRGDSAYRDASLHALPRSEGNPLFTRADKKYAGIYVMEDNRISYARVFGSVTPSSNAIGAFSDETDWGLDSTDVRMNILFGSNAIGRAWAKETFMRRRKEDDYGNLIGFGGGYIYGDRRADWLDDAAGSTTKNQSSFIAYTYSPNPNSNVTAIW